MMHAAVQTAPAPSDAPAVEMTLFAHQRAAIDMIATLRARMVRCALFATNILRPHPVTPESGQACQKWHDEFAEQYAGIERSYALLSGHDPAGVLPKEVCDWIAQNMQAWPRQMNVLTHMLGLTTAVRDALSGNEQDLDTAMKSHLTYGRGTFYDAVTEICDGLWADLDLQRAGDVSLIQESGRGLESILDRLERIGKHVRLVSLNASVEAARVGDAGKGLGVIAVEFKSLAEEIQHLAATARANIEGMTGNSR